MTLGAIVLCGGGSTRMGRPKAWLPFGPETMLARVVRLVGASAGPVVVVAAPGQDLPALPEGVRVVRDPIGGRGPLQGIVAGLEAIGGGTLAYATATDSPFLAPGWVGLLARLIGAGDLAIPEVDGRLQPLSALYRPSASIPAARALLEQGRARPSDLAGLVRARVVGADELVAVDPDLATLTNINTPDEYREALRRAGLLGD